MTIDKAVVVAVVVANVDIVVVVVVVAIGGGGVVVAVRQLGRRCLDAPTRQRLARRLARRRRRERDGAGDGGAGVVVVLGVGFGVVFEHVEAGGGGLETQSSLDEAMRAWADACEAGLIGCGVSHADSNFCAAAVVYAKPEQLLLADAAPAAPAVAAAKYSVAKTSAAAGAAAAAAVAVTVPSEFLSSGDLMLSPHVSAAAGVGGDGG